MSSEQYYYPNCNCKKIYCAGIWSINDDRKQFYMFGARFFSHMTLAEPEQRWTLPDGLSMRQLVSTLNTFFFFVTDKEAR